LESLITKINSLQIGVKASIIQQPNSTYKLVLNSENIGGEKNGRCCGNCRTVTGISDCTGGETYKNDGFICDDQTGVCTPIHPNCCKIPFSQIEVWNHNPGDYDESFKYKLYENGKTQEEIDAIPWKYLGPNRWSGEIVTFPGGTDVVFAATSSNVSHIFTSNRILEPGVSYWAHQWASLHDFTGPNIEIKEKGLIDFSKY
jgi:hypothetical protein